MIGPNFDFSPHTIMKTKKNLKFRWFIENDSSERDISTRQLCFGIEGHCEVHNYDLYKRYCLIVPNS